MIDTLVFDIGNVLVDWYPLEFCKTFVKDEEEAKELCHIVFDGPEFKNGDCGLYSREDTRRELLKNYPDKRDLIEKALDGCDDILKASKENTQLLKELKEKGFHLFFLSNTNPQAFEYMTSRHEFFNYLEGGIASFKVKLLKPSHEIFELFLKTYNKKPEQCVFVDDTPVNTASAREVGYNTVTLPTVPSLREELMKFDDVRRAFN